MDKKYSTKRRKTKRPKVIIRPYRIRPADLRRMVRAIAAAEIPETLRVVEAGYRLSAYILLEFFGPDWIDYYVTHEGLRRKSSYFGDIDKFVLRVGTLAEMLLNLQDIPGFTGCLELLADGRIEAGYAELEVGKYLSMFSIKFSFNERKLRTKEDYDLNVTFKNGQQGYAEIKCKYETTILSEATIFNSLRTARGQLPDDVPAVVFVKIPKEWITEKPFAEMATAAVKRFLRPTKTVVAVELFVSDFTFEGLMAEPLLVGLEILNDHHKFDASRDWSLIGILPRWTELIPPFWWKSIPALVDPSVDPRFFGS